jgi:hypothetical protein
MTNNVGNPDPGLGQTPKCGRIKPVNETQYITYIIIGNFDKIKYLFDEYCYFFHYCPPLLTFSDSDLKTGYF